MISAIEEIKKIERQKKQLEKLLDLESDMNEKEKEYLKSKEKYEIQVSKIFNTASSEQIEKKEHHNHE